MKRAFLLSATFVLFTGCNPSSESSSNRATNQLSNTSCPPAYVFLLEHDHLPPNKKRIENVSWRLVDRADKAGALRHHDVTTGQIVEWRSQAGPHGTNFGIAVPRSGSVTWTNCDQQAQWYNPSNGFFPADFAVVNAWEESGDYVVRLQVNSIAPSNCAAWYKLVVPQYDTNATRLPPFDYFMVDATLDVSPYTK